MTGNAALQDDLGSVAELLKKLDICMLTTRTARGLLTSRPMSNNGDVEYDGNSYFFSYEDSSVVKDIKESPQVNLGFEGPKHFYISVSGRARIIRSKTTMEDHWLPELKRWFDQGIDTPGIVMIHVKGNRIKYWQQEDQGEIRL